MDKISFSDLFDFGDDGELNKAIQAVDGFEAQLQKLAAALQLFSDRNAKAMSAIVTDLTKSEASLKKLNVTSKETQEQAVKLASSVDKEVARWKELEASQKGIIATQNLFNDSVKGVKDRLKQLTAEFDLVTQSQNPEKWQELARKIQDTKAEIQMMTAATKATRTAVDAANGSYNQLVQQNAALTKILKSSEGGLNNNSEAANKLKAQIYANTQQLKDFDKELNQSFRNVGNYAESIIQAKNALNQQKQALQANLAALNQQAQATGRTVAEQNKVQAELAQTRTALDGVTNELKRYGEGVGNADNLTGKITGGIKRMGLEMVGAYVGFQALIQGVSGIIKANGEISDSQADVQKTTGATAEEVDKLTQSFAKLDTRTALKDLLDMAKVGGQLGISTGDIEGFTKAMDKASVALGDEFTGGAEEIATALAKINNVFGTSKEVGLERGLTNIGSAVNALGSAGAATGPYLADFALRVGAVAKNMGISLPNVLGYGAALEELGVSAEVAGTAFKQILTAQAANVEGFFNVAKMADANLTLKEFTDLINKDANAAFNKFIKGANAGGKETTAFASILADLKLKGGGANTVLTSLAKQTDLVASRQKLAAVEMAKGTSLLTEFNVKNENLAAGLAKLKNSIVNTFTGTAVQNFLKEAVKGLIDFIAVSKEVIKTLYDNRNVIGVVALVYAAYRVQILATSIAEKGWAVSMGLTRLGILQRIAALAATVPALLSQKAAIFANVVAERGWGVAMGLSRVAILRNIVAMRAWATSFLISNPIGIAIVAITGLVLGFNKLSESSDRNIEVNGRLNKIHRASEFAMVQVGLAQGKINKQIEDYNNLSPQQQANLKKDIENQKKLALATLARLEAERLAAVKSAANINIYDKVAAAVLAGGNASLFAQNILEGQTKRMGDASDASIKDINKLRAAIQGFDKETEAINSKQKQREEENTAANAAAAEADDKARKKRQLALLELQKFRVEQQALALEEFAADAKAQNDIFQKQFQEGKITAEQLRDKIGDTGLEILNAQREASLARIRIAGIERNILLANEDLIGEERTKIIEEYSAKVTAIQKKLQKDLAIEELVPTLPDTDYESVAKIEDEAVAASVKRMADFTAKYKESEEARTKALKEEEEKRKAIREAGLEFAGNAINGFFELGAAFNERNLSDLEKQKEAETALAGDNEEAKAKIAEDYDKRMAALRIKQAKADRLAALFNIALNTGIAVAKSIAATPITFGLPFSAFALAQGAIQAAIVLAKPLPTYAKGRKDGEAELAITNELGPELREHKGKFYIDPRPGPQLTYLEKGEKVYTHVETERLLQDIITGDQNTKYITNLTNNTQTISKQLNPAPNLAAAELVARKVGQQMWRIETAIKNKKETHIGIDNNGFNTWVEEKNSRTVYLNKRYRDV